MTVRTPPRTAAPAPRRQLGLGGWVKGQSMAATSRLIHIGLWAVLGLVAVAALAAFFRPAPNPPAPHIPASTSGAEGFAQLYVSTYLTVPPGDPALAAFWPGHADLGLHPPVSTATPPPALKVVRTVALDPVELAPTYWSVVVGAVVQAPDAATSTRFFRVAVLRTDAKVYVATALPAEIAAPLGARLPVLAVDHTERPDATDPTVATAARFLGALLTGEGELGRYTAPGATVRPVRPAPYSGVEVTGMGTRGLPGGHVEALVDAVGTDAAGRLFPLTYPLEMAQRAGRWEVVAIRAAPTIPRAQPSLTPSTVVAPAVSVPTPTTTNPATVPTTNPSSQTTTTLRRN